MNQALILVLQEDENGPNLIINSGGLDLEQQNHQRQALAMLRQAEEFFLSAILKPPCPDCREGGKDGD